MKRAAEERHLALQTKRKAEALMQAKDWPSRDFPINSYRKTRRIAGCGHARCHSCHAYKLMGQRSVFAMRAVHVYRDQLEELAQIGYRPVRIPPPNRVAVIKRRSNGWQQDLHPY